jgi:hypothetical protein
MNKRRKYVIRQAVQQQAEQDIQAIITDQVIIPQTAKERPGLLRRIVRKVFTFWAGVS